MLGETLSAGGGGLARRSCRRELGRRLSLSLLLSRLLGVWIGDVKKTWDAKRIEVSSGVSMRLVWLPTLRYLLTTR